MYIIKKYSGMTLIEILLVLAIISLIVIMGFRQYRLYKISADALQLQANVDTIFLAMSNYFRANCSGLNNSDPNSQIFKTYYDQVYLPIDINTLQTSGYLQQNLTRNAFVKQTGTSTATSGYVLQFNQLQIANALPLKTANTTVSPTQSIGNVVVWQIQIAVQLNPKYSAQTVQALLNANCISNSGGTNLTNGLTFVTPCSSAPLNATQYAVFTRLPTAPTKQKTTTYWPSLPAARLFNKMYSVDPILLLTDPGVSSPNTTQYYLCNG